MAKRKEKMELAEMKLELKKAIDYLVGEIREVKRLVLDIQGMLDVEPMISQLPQGETRKDETGMPIVHLETGQPGLAEKPIETLADKDEEKVDD